MSVILGRILALDAERRALYARAGRGEPVDRQRLIDLSEALAAAWTHRRKEKMCERLARQTGMRCQDCHQPLTPFVVGRIGPRVLPICESCRRSRISAGRQRQIAADRRRYSHAQI